MHRSHKHRGIIGSGHLRNYALNNLEAALADPVIKPFCALRGGLFPLVESKPPTKEVFQNLLDGRDPEFGHLLKKKTNEGTRLERDKRAYKTCREGTGHIWHQVSNVCHGFDVPISVGKTVSIAALVLGDQRLRNLSYSIITQELTKLGEQTDRRLPRQPGQQRIARTGLAALIIVPEKSDRGGHPHLHCHGYFANITGYRDGLYQRYCAAHFQQIAKGANRAQKDVDRRLFRSLLRHGYPVHMERGRCVLASVPTWLIERYSMEPRNPDLMWAAFSLGDRQLEARRRDDAYLLTRGKKILQSLAQWNLQWDSRISQGLLSKLAREHYHSVNPPKTAAMSDDRILIQPLAPVRTAPTDDRDSDQVLLPIRKSTLFSAIPTSPQRTQTAHPDPVSSVVQTAESYAYRSSNHWVVAAGPAPRFRITIAGDPQRLPWLTLHKQMMELAFPEAEVGLKVDRIKEARVTMEEGPEGLAALVVQAGSKLAAQCACMVQPERSRLVGLLQTCREHTQVLRQSDSLVIARQAYERGKLNYPNLEIAA